MSKHTPVSLEFEGEELEGVFVGRRDSQARPTVMLIPTVMGVSDLELGFGVWDWDLFQSRHSLRTWYMLRNLFGQHHCKSV